jgi:DNA-binding XRE family transcriptional regulator
VNQKVNKMKQPNRKLEQFRKGLGLNKPQFAELVGLNQFTIHNYESGREKIRYSSWMKMKQRLKENSVELSDDIFHEAEDQSAVDESNLMKADSLLACRELLGYTRTEMAKVVGLTESGYRRYECGEREPLAEVWLKFKEHARMHGIQLVEAE